ncbi:MAG: DNA repair protein RecN [Clostridia bacterium]|nr:DNA repair protein RecN [Clostridia bacterium]
MISSLSLSNVALIKKQNISFENGFNCLLGQSGAGKSIIIDALSFVLGAKADKTLIRSGETQMRVDATFVDYSKEVSAFLSEQDIDEDNELIVTRTLSVDGKSSVKVNGFPMNAKTLQTLSALLIDFCGQHDSVGLLNTQNHIAILDQFGSEEIEPCKSDVAVLYDELRRVDSEISSLGGNEQERERTKELLKYQIEEIEEANLTVGEDSELKEKFEFMSAAENIFDKLNDVLLKLDTNRENANALVYEAKSELNEFSNFKNIDECRERLENCYYELKDITETLADIKRNTEFDPQELERIDERLELIKKLSRKYGKTIEDMLKFLEESKSKLETLENSEFILEKLQKQREKTLLDLENACKKLSDVRKKVASVLEEKIVSELADLEMKGTFFKVDFEKSDFSKNGFDNVKFMFSANKGQEIKDLHKTASGGELSRLLLAFKNIMLDKEGVQTVVFDEIDSGISGHTAGRLAEKVANISKYTQVICITHTPVVASKANNFLLVEKKVVDDNTISTVKTLSGDEPIVEVARLIDGGKDVSATAIEHSKKLFS